MNNARRKKLQKIYDQLEELKEKLDFIIEEEQTAFDNMPDSLWECCSLKSRHTKVEKSFL